MPSHRNQPHKAAPFHLHHDIASPSSILAVRWPSYVLRSLEPTSTSSRADLAVSSHPLLSISGIPARNPTRTSSCTSPSVIRRKVCPPTMILTAASADPARRSILAICHPSQDDLMASFSFCAFSYTQSFKPARFLHPHELLLTQSYESSHPLTLQFRSH